MRRLTHMRIAAAAVLAAVLMPTALCFGAVTSSPHPCCMKQARAWQDGSGANNECCVVSAPAPSQAAVVTSTDPGSKAAAPALVASQLSAPAVRQASEASSSSEHSPPDLADRTTLRI
ncbi:MAG TPA: hypothetical protein VF840_07780 [Terriglobales bacterium]